MSNTVLFYSIGRVSNTIGLTLIIDLLGVGRNIFVELPYYRTSIHLNFMKNVINIC